MFGLVVLIIIIFIYFIGISKESVEDSNDRKKAIREGSTTYINGKGQCCLVSNGHPVYVITNKDGSTQTIDCKTNKVIDYTLPKYFDMLATTIQNDFCTVCFHESNRADKDLDHSKDVIKGRRYRDIKTGDVYVARSIRLPIGSDLLFLNNGNKAYNHSNYIEVFAKLDGTVIRLTDDHLYFCVPNKKNGTYIDYSKVKEYITNMKINLETTDNALVLMCSSEQFRREFKEKLENANMRWEDGQLYFNS